MCNGLLPSFRPPLCAPPTVAVVATRIKRTSIRVDQKKTKKDSENQRQTSVAWRGVPICENQNQITGKPYRACAAAHEAVSRQLSPPPPLLLQLPSPGYKIERDGNTGFRSADFLTGACGYNRPCAHQYVGKSQSCMVKNVRLIPHAS